ncbi:MAG: hypothetical protein ACJAYR_000902 [Sneathiella sp.]|jgi:hypothetical protein
MVRTILHLMNILMAPTKGSGKSVSIINLPAFGARPPFSALLSTIGHSKSIIVIAE